jgi:hypothetical protein
VDPAVPEACFSGVCTRVNCNVDGDCNDGVACTTNRCDVATHRCVFTPVDALCNGTFCAPKRCDGVQGCVAQEPPACPNAPPCQVGVCNTTTQACDLAPIADGTTCSDGNACNGAETCRGGSCGAGSPPNCDGNPCTTDSCDSATGCRQVTVADGTICDDANACSTADTSSAGGCLGVPAPNPSWGSDVSAARNHFPVHIWWALFPGAAISLTVLAFNLLGDSLRDVFDPRLRGRL